MTLVLAIVTWSLRGSVLLAAALIAVRLMKTRSAAEREAVLRVALVAFSVLPIFGAFVPEIAVSLPVVEPGDTFATSAPSLSLPEVLLPLWLCGAAIGAFRIVASAVSVLRLRRASRAARIPAAHAIAERFGIGRRLTVRTSSAPVAMTWGLFRPVVIVPEDERGRDAVLRHELAHVARFDAFVLALGEVLRAIHWFNPLVALALRWARIESERASDDLAVAAGADPLDLAEQLVRFSRTRSAPRIAAAMAELSDLDARVRSLLAGERGRPGVPRRLLAACVALAFSAAAAVTALAPRAVADVTAFARAYRITPALASSIIRAAEEERLDTDLAFALVAVESRFDTSAISKRGAIGLTQILPSTARLVEPALARERLFEPETNLRVGFRCLRTYLDRYGSLPVALNAYNIGERAVERHQARSHPLPQEYVRRVLGAVRR